MVDRRRNRARVSRHPSETVRVRNGIGSQFGAITVNDRQRCFTELIVLGSDNRHLFNSGGGYRITDTQQIDFHIGIGLNDNAPAYIFGVGYSFRFDRLF